MLLLRTDRAARTLPLLALGGAVLGALPAVAVRDLFARGEHFERAAGVPMAVVLFQVLVLSWSAAIWCGARDRADEMRLALPVSPRTWVGTRAAALVLVGWVPLALAVSAVAAGTGSAVVLSAVLPRAAAAALGWAAWVALCFAWQPERPRLDSTLAFVAIALAGAALAWTGLVAPAAGAALSLAVLFPAALVARRGVPAVMEIHGGRRAAPERRTITRATRSSSSAVAAAGPEGTAAIEPWSEPPAPAERRPRAPFVLPVRTPGRLLRVWIARRTWLRGRNAAVPLAIVVLLIVAEAGPLPDGFALGYVTYCAWMMMTASLRVLREVDHLPVPRARLAPHVLAPPLLALVAGGAAGILVGPWSDDVMFQRVDLVDRDPGYSSTPDVSGPRVLVPGVLARPVLGTAPLVVRAPSGESATLYPEPVIRGLPLAIVNPYDVGPGSSMEFVAWQLARALRDAHGVEIEPGELRERYLSAPDGRAWSFSRRRFLDDHPEARPIPRAGRAGLHAWTLALAWMLVAWAVTRPNVPPADGARRRLGRIRFRLLQAAAVAAFLALLLLPVLLFERSFRRPSFENALAAALVEAVGGAEWVLPAAALGFAALVYVAAARRFERLEVPPALRKTWFRSVV